MNFQGKRKVSDWVTGTLTSILYSLQVKISVMIVYQIRNTLLDRNVIIPFSRGDMNLWWPADTQLCRVRIEHSSTFFVCCINGR